MIEEYFKNCLKEVERMVNINPKNAPAQRRIFKQNYSFSDLSSTEQLIIWDFIWNNASDFWIRMHSFLFCESKIRDKDFLVKSWDIIKHWQKKVNNWGDCDALSKIYTKILELIPDKVLEQLERWNKSTNLWDRRQSIVSLLYFSRTKKVILPYNSIIQFIDRLINDKEYYVQKGVGWSLKELYNVYPAETLKYFENNIKKISPIAFTAATEKLNKGDKERLKKLRKS